MSVTRDQVVSEARRWLGVRWRHQGRTRDGIDCVGLLIVVARALALLPAARIDEIEHATAGYARYPRGSALRAWCARELAEVDIAAARAGDVVLFRVDAEPQHLALLGDHPQGGLSLVHASARSPHRVVETRFDDGARRLAAAAYALPGVS